MFKSILPSKRVNSTDFTMVTPLGDQNVNVNAIQGTSKSNAKFNGILPGKGFPPNAEKQKRSDTKGREQVQDVQGMDMAFDRLLDDLQIPSTLRPKLNGMDSTVKAAMLKSSQVMVLPKSSPSPPHTPPPRSMALRRARSTDTLGSPMVSHDSFDTLNDIRPPQLPFAGSRQVSAYHPPSPAPASRKASTHSRGVSMDTSGWKSSSQLNLLASKSVTDLTLLGKPGKEKAPAAAKNLTPAKIISILSATSSTQIDIEVLKKLRLYLRNESAGWTQEFLVQGGYTALLTRLNELLEVEWREEQHDDQALHELLRCFKALSTSAIGAFALRSSCPTPFVQLVALLYSDKKPGDVPTRQLIVELLLILFEVYPPSSLPSSGNPRTNLRREAWETDLAGGSALICLPAPHKNFFSLIRALLLTPAPPPSESPAAPVSPHAFIESLHKARIYKTYLQELSDVCRDYFWVFCHPNNTIWNLAETDESRVEKPRAPGGMTGGVEFEAMGYFTTHLKLLNAIAKSAADLNLPRDNDHSAYRFHSDLFLSGLERIILVSRKASTTYYPSLHLELARYLAQAGRAGYEIPWTVSRLIGSPPTSACKNPTPTQSGKNTPASRSGHAQLLATPRKIDGRGA